VKKILFAFLTLILLFEILCPQVSAAQRFVQVEKDEDFDIYMDVGNMRKANGILYFWVKTMYSDSGKALIRRELPRRLRKASIEYGMDYFEYDTKKNVFRASFCSVYDNEDKEVFREGSRKWRSIEPGVACRNVDRKRGE